MKEIIELENQIGDEVDREKTVDILPLSDFDPPSGPDESASP